MSMRRCERLLGEYCLGKAGWRIGELMGENRAYPLWLYPRIHVHPRDPTGSLRTSSDWAISKPHGFHRRYLSPDDIAPSNPYLSAPISTRRQITSGLISIECLVYFWICLTFFVIPFVSFHHAQPFYPCFIFSLRLCAPLIHSFPDSSPDISLFISLTAPHAFVLC